MESSWRVVILTHTIIVLVPNLAGAQGRSLSIYSTMVTGHYDTQLYWIMTEVLDGAVRCEELEAEAWHRRHQYIFLGK